MVQLKSPYSRFTILMAITSLFFSASEALPIAGNEMALPPANWTYPPFLPDRVSVSLQKRSDTVVQATSAQVAEYKKYAGIAATAYCRTVVPLKFWNCDQCLKQVPDGKLIASYSTLVTDASGFVLRSDNDKVIYVVFRGTNSVRQGIDDLVFNLTNYTPVSGAKVHLGFYASLKEAIPFYFASVQDQLTKYPKYKVVVTGHSLGAAQALLAGLDFFQRDSRFTKSNLFIHTAGSPRVGNDAFAKYVVSTGLTYTRSVNKNDIVPHVPPESFGYLHAGVEVWSKTGSNTVICTSTIESDKCAETLPALSLTITDHLSYYGINEGLCL